MKAPSLVYYFLVNLVCFPPEFVLLEKVSFMTLYSRKKGFEAVPR